MLCCEERQLETAQPIKHQMQDIPILTHPNIKPGIHEGTPSRSAAKYRAALLQMAAGRRFTHWVTLTTHDDYTLTRANERLRRWRVEVFRRLHGRRFFDLPEDQRVYYIGCPELGMSGRPHFHLACWVPDELHAQFVDVGRQRWQAIVPTGRFHQEPFGDGPNAVRYRLGYAGKQLHARSDLPFVDSRIYR